MCIPVVVELIHGRPNWMASWSPGQTSAPRSDVTRACTLCAWVTCMANICIINFVCIESLKLVIFLDSFNIKYDKLAIHGWCKSYFLTTRSASRFMLWWQRLGFWVHQASTIDFRCFRGGGCSKEAVELPTVVSKEGDGRRRPTRWWSRGCDDWVSFRWRWSTSVEEAPSTTIENHVLRQQGKAVVR